MGRKITFAGCTALAAVLLTGGAITLGAGDGGRSTEPGGPGASATAPTHLSAPAFPVASPHGSALRTRASKSKQVSIRYFETKKTIDVKSGEDYFTFSGKPCPQGSKAISGYSFYAGTTLPPALVADGGNAPLTLRNWQFYLSNPNGDEVDENVKFGIICAKHVD